MLPGFLGYWISSPTRSEYVGLKDEADTAFWLYIAANIIKTIYSFIWDIYMDWGLCRSNKRGDENRYLRPKINYHPCFYYWAIFSDFILRFIWILFLFRLGEKDSSFNNLDIMFCLSIYSEGFRRAQWALLRVENEQNNNLEAYRTIPIIPPIVSSHDMKGSSGRN